MTICSKVSLSTTTVSKPTVTSKYIIKEHKASPVKTSFGTTLPINHPSGQKQGKKYKIVRHFKRLKRLKAGRANVNKAQEAEKRTILHTPEDAPVEWAMELGGMDAFRLRESS